MKMRKIVALLAAALMLFSIMPLSAMAADTQVVFDMGANGTATHADGNKYSAYTEDADGYTLTLESLNNVYGPARDAKGNGCIKLGASSKAGGFSFTVPADVTSVIIAVGKYKANTTKLTVNGTTYTLNMNSNDGAYDEIVIDTTTEKTITLTTISGGYRAMVNSITYVIPAGNADCDHSQYTCGDTCEVCGEVFVHEYSKACTEVCDNGCGTANPDAVAHTYTHSLATFCSVCGDERTVVMPTDPAELVDAAYALPANEAFPEAVTLTGIISSVDTAFDSSYNNVTVTIDVLDSEGNVIADKPIQCFRLKGTGADLIGEGDTITVSGIIVNYNGSKIEFDSGCTLVSYEQTGCEHQYEFECSTTCQLCGKGEREAVCVTNAQFACADGLCVYCGNDVDALEHTFDDEWDPDCNYGCGYTREVEEKPDMTEATLDFSTLDQRTEYSTSIQVWTNGSLVLTNNKGGSTSSVGNYSNPARFYKGSEIIIAYPGMTKLVINCPTGTYGDPWAATLDAAGLTYTVDGGVYTVTFAAPVDSITLTTTAQVRANSMTATAVKTGDDACNHVWVDATCTAPKTCSICGAVEGTVLDHDWEIISQADATCTADGSIVYECAACGEDKSETFPAIPHNYVDSICSACGAELPLQVDKIDDVANLTAGTYYLAGYATGYANGTTVEDWSSYPWHVWTGEVYSGDLVTTPYYYSESNGGFGIADPTVSGTLIELQAVEGKADTYYIVCNAKYLASTENATSRRLALVTEPTEAIPVEWVATANENGGITLSSNDVYMGTGEAASRLVRAYKAESTLQYGVVLFSFDNEAPACEHEYDNACDVDCNLCGETREVTHNVVHVEAVAPTCTADGNIEYWFCDVCGAAWLDEACTLNTNLKAVVLPMAEHTYDDCLDADCNVCGETREPGHNLTHFEAVEATNCQETGHAEYWYCENCGCYFGDAEATWQHNPGWLFTTGECVRPEGAADCATVPCTLCGNDTYGTGEHDVVACQGGVCSKCGDTIEGYGHQNYDGPACLPGNCYYCGEAMEPVAHENGAWAPCLEGECAYGCGLTYPATADHVDADGDDYCDVCYNHLAHIDADADGFCDTCWSPMPVTDILYGDADGDGEITLTDASTLQLYLGGYEVTIDEAAADADGDGEITLTDASTLQLYLGGYDVTLGPADEPTDDPPQFNDGEFGSW